MTYFDVPGIAQCIRNLLNDYGIDYVDQRVSSEQFKAMNLPYGQLPVLHVGTEVFAQSKAILRYAGKLTRTYAKDPIHSLGIDELIDLHTDFVSRIQCHLYPAKWGLSCMDEDARAKQRAWLIDEWIPTHLQYLETHLSHGAYLGGFDAPTIADYCWKATLVWLRDGGLPSYEATDWSYSINAYCDSNIPLIEESDEEKSKNGGEIEDDEGKREGAFEKGANKDDSNKDDNGEPKNGCDCDDETSCCRN